MADYDLEALSLPELKKMQKDVAKAISTFEDRQKADARAKVEAFARDLGYSLAELIGHLAVAIGRLPFPEPVIRAWRRVGQERPHVDGQCEPCPSERLSQRAGSRPMQARQGNRSIWPERTLGRHAGYLT